MSTNGSTAGGGAVALEAAAAAAAAAAATGWCFVVLVVFEALECFGKVRGRNLLNLAGVFLGPPGAMFREARGVSLVCTGRSGSTVK